MTPTYQVVYKPLAQKMILEAMDYLTEQAGEGNAQKWLASMLKSIEALETLSMAFHVWTYRHGIAIYSNLVKPYCIFFLVNDFSLTMHVIDAVHTARDSKLAPYRDQSS